MTTLLSLHVCFIVVYIILPGPLRNIYIGPFGINREWNTASAGARMCERGSLTDAMELGLLFSHSIGRCLLLLLISLFLSEYLYINASLILIMIIYFDYIVDKIYSKEPQLNKNNAIYAVASALDF